jgi:hypothetical protein
LSEGGNVLELCSRREPKRTVKIAEFIVKSLTGQTAKYSEVINSFDMVDVEEFINRLGSNAIKDTELLSIRVRNVPLANSPTVELECSECIVPAINQLQHTYRLPIMKQPADIVSLRLRFDGRSYSLKLRGDGSKIEFVSDNKNLRDNDKQNLSRFLSENISKGSL